MDASRFDAVLRALTTAPSRRGMLRGLLAAALGLPALRFPAEGSAKKNKKRKKKLKRNEFGCVDVGGKCRGKDANCCSGICDGKKPKKGKKDKSRCVAHDEGNCQPGQNECNGPTSCTTTGGNGGDCVRTTGNAEFCTSDAFSDVACTTDDECVSECGEGAACVINCSGDAVCVGRDISCGIG